MTNKVSALDMAVQDARAALEARLFYAALVVALTIPDICAALESEDGRTSADQYRDWCGRYVALRLGVGPESIYDARCGIVHTAQLKSPKQRTASYGAPFGTANPKPLVQRVVFVVPIDGRSTIHCNQLEDSVQFDIGLFCEDMLSSLADWWKDKKDSDVVKKNMKNLIHYYPRGLSPYIKDRPAIL